MKNQYFGDKNDFIKYDLVLTLIESVKKLKAFTFIPMLTENDGSGEGALTNYDGRRRKDLDIFLRKCVSNNERKVCRLQDHMINKDITYIPYKDTEYFRHYSRSDYFNGIKEEILKDTVILVDTDNGFEVTSMRNCNGNKYVKYSEVQELYNKMDSNSVLIVYQHIGRVNRTDFFNSVGGRLKRELSNGQVICISDNVIVLFIITKDLIAPLVEDVVHKYAEQNKYKFHQIDSSLAEEVVNPKSLIGDFNSILTKIAGVNKDYYNEISCEDMQELRELINILYVSKLS